MRDLWERKVSPELLPVFRWRNQASKTINMLRHIQARLNVLDEEAPGEGFPGIECAEVLELVVNALYGALPVLPCDCRPGKICEKCNGARWLSFKRWQELVSVGNFASSLRDRTKPRVSLSQQIHHLRWLRQVKCVKTFGGRKGEKRLQSSEDSNNKNGKPSAMVSDPESSSSPSE